MSHLRVLNALEAVVKATADRAGRTVNALRSQAPGARMIGEFAVRMGLDHIKRRVTPPPAGRGNQPAPPNE